MDSTNGKVDDFRLEAEKLRKELEETRRHLDMCRAEKLALEQLLNKKNDETEGLNAFSALQINNILTSIKEIIFVANTNREIVFISPAVYKIAGYQPEEILGQPIRNFVHPDDWHVLQSIKDQLEKGGNAKVELRAANKQGDYVWLSVSVSTLFIENQVREFTGIITDITEVKLIESKLQERERLNQTLMEASPDVIIFTDWNGNIEMVSTNACNMFGIAHPDEAKGQSLLKFIRPDFHKLVIERISFIKKNRRRGELEMVLVRADGSDFDAGVTGEVIQSTESTPGRMVFMVRDISAWKKTQRELVESESRFRHMFENMAQGVIYQDPEGQIIRFNPAAERIFGLSGDELLKRTSTDGSWKAIREDGTDFPGEEHPSMVCLRTGKPVSNVLMGIFQPRENDYIWILVSSTPLFHEGEEKPSEVFTTISDITSTIRAEKDLRASESRFRVLFESAPVGITIVNLDGQLLMVNRKFTETTGYSLEDMPDMEAWWKLAYPDPNERTAVMEEFSQKMAGFLQTGIPLEPYEGHIRCKDGTARYLEINLTTSGEILLGTFVDVTERKKDADLILEQKRYTETILSAIRDSKFILDRQGYVIEYIPSTQSIQIITPEQLLGRNIFTALPWLPVETVKEYMNQTFDGLPTIPFQFEVPGHETIRFVEARMSKIDDERIIVLASDITWRVSAEEELKETHRRLTVTMNNLRGVVYRCKNETHWPMEFVSQGVTELTGYQPDDFTGTSLISFGKLIHEDDRNRVWHKIQKNVAERTAYTIEYRIFNRDGSIKWVWERGQGIFEGDRLVALEGFISDITARRQAIEDLKQREENYRTLFEDSPVAYALIKNNRFVQCNKATEALLRTSKPEIIGLSPMDLSPEFQPDGQRSDELAPRLMQLAWENGTHTFEWSHIRLDGEPFLAGITLTRMKYEGEDLLLLAWKDITEQREAEGQVRKLISAVEQSPVSIVITDRQGMIEYANPKTCEATGYTYQELVGQNPRILKSGETPSEEYSSLWKTISQGKEWKGIFHNRKKNGDYFWESSTIAPIMDSTGKITHYIAIKEDITERKNIQEALVQSENRYRKVNEHSKTVVWEVDLEGKYTYVSPVAESVFGYSPEEMEGKMYFYEIMPEDRREEFRTMGLEIIRDGEELRDFINPIQKKDGSLIWVTTDGTIMVDQDNKTIGYRGADNDITEKLKAEEELRKFRTISDQANYGTAVTTLDGTFLYVNDAFAGMHGWDKQELIGMNLRDLHLPERLPVVEDLLETLCFHGGFKAKEVWRSRKDGTIFPSLMTATVIYNDMQEPQYLSATIIDITNQKAQEEEIREHNNKLKAIIAAMPDKIFEHDSDGNFLGFYLRDPDTLLAPKDVVIGMNIRDIFTPEAAEINIRSINECLERQALVNHEFHEVIKDQLRYFEVRTVPLGEHRVLRFVRDITDKKLKELEIKKLTIAIEQSPVSIVVTDPQGNFEYISPAFTEITGYTWEDVAGKHTRMLQSGLTNNEMYTGLWSSISKGQTWVGEWLNKKKNGELYWEKVVISPITGEKGEILNFVAIKEDITERKRAEQEILELNTSLEKKVAERTLELARSNKQLVSEIEERKRVDEALMAKTEELEKFFTLSLDLLGITDLTGKFLKVNNAFETILGYPASHFENRNFTEFLHPGDIDSTKEVVESLKTTKKAQGFINRYKRIDGTYRNIEWHVVLVGDRLYAAARDVTERLLLEETLKATIAKEKELSELKSRFVSMASHEFRTPLATILMAAETLLTYWKKLDEVRIHGKLLTVVEQVKHLTGIVTNVLQVSRIQEGKITFIPRETDLVYLVSSAVHSFNQDKSLQNKIRFSCDFEELKMHLDKQLMQQVMNNLLSNAVKYSQPDPRVEVEIARVNNSIQISVKDNGVGIPEQDMSNMFQPFFRAGNVFNIEGNGLGLTIVRECVRLHGGDVSFTSTQGKGSTFIVTLPDNG